VKGDINYVGEWRAIGCFK